MRQRAALLGHHLAVERAANAFYGSSLGEGSLRHEAQLALASADITLAACNDTQPNLETVWELKGALGNPVLRLVSGNVGVHHLGQHVQPCATVMLLYVCHGAVHKTSGQNLA